MLDVERVLNVILRNGLLFTSRVDMSLYIDTCFEEIFLNLFGSLTCVQAYLESPFSCVDSLECIMLEVSGDHVTHTC